jgi:hypothetical protein
MNDTIDYAILIGAALAVAALSAYINTKARAWPTRYATMAGVWAGLGLALATLIKLATEVWS